MEFIDAIAEPVLVIDRSYRIEQANAAFLNLCGFRHEEVIGGNCYMISHAEDGPCLMIDTYCPLERVFATGTSVTVTHTHRCKDGSTRVFEVKATPLFGADGKVEKMVELLVDKTESRTARDRMRTAEEFLHSVLDGIGDGVVVVSDDLKIIEANRRYSVMCGIEEERLKGMHCYRASHKSDRPCFESGEECPVIETFRTGVHSRATHVHYDVANSPVYVEINAYPLKDQRTGRVNAVIETINDITEQVRLREQLKKTESSFRELYNGSPEMLFTLDEEGNIIQCNRAMEKTLGFERSWLKGRSVTDILSPEARKRFQERMSGCQLDDICELELEFVTIRGTAIPVEMTANVQAGEGGMIYNVIARDLTERKAAEQEKRLLEAQLLQAQKMEAIGTLSAGIAHDFNNILTGLIGYVELAEKQQDLSRVGQYLTKIKELLMVASNLTRQLLLIGRKAEAEYEVIDLNAFLTEFVATMQRIIEDTIEVKSDLAPQRFFVSGDASQLYQMMMNLVINARDAMPRGGSLHVATRFVEQSEVSGRYHHVGDADVVMISVRDTGEGIAPENIKKIFDPFFTTKDKTARKGTGLGLSVVYTIVNCHRGWIEVDSEVGMGSEFRIYLPLTDESPAASEITTSLSSFSSGGTILVIDDEDIILDVVATILEDGGYRVLKASRGEKGIDMFRDNHESIDVVIVDHMMPGMDGIAVFDKLREIDPAVKVVISSGYSSASRDDLLAKGFAGYLKKPYKIDELLQTIHGIIQ